jgi:hypothetical protein
MSRKPNPFIVSLNQPPKGPHLGKHRRTAPQAHRDPTDGADPGAGRTTTLRTDLPPATWRNLTLMPFPTSPASGGGRNVTLADYKVLTAQLNPFFETLPPTIPYAGVRSGEIIAHRLWWVIDGKLCSWVHRQIWEPGEAMHGDINAVVDGWGVPIYGGVYGFADHTLTAIDADRFIKETKQYKKEVFAYRFPIHETSVFVLGSIALWGDVVEHECGWRGEFAKVNSLDRIYCIDDSQDPTNQNLILQHLRTTYALPQPKLPDLPREW